MSKYKMAIPRRKHQSVTLLKCLRSMRRTDRQKQVSRHRWNHSLLVAIICMFLSPINSAWAADAEFPARPVKVVVPFAAGGGSDTFGRIIQNAIRENELLPQPMVIVNVPGAGGTIGSRRVRSTRPDGYTIMLLHEGILTARHSGQAPFGPEAFTPIIGTGDSTQVIAVSADSEFDDLKTLMDETAEHPGKIVFSANIGAPSHFAGLMLQGRREGAEFRYTQNGGGAKRLAAILGGHVDVSAFSIAEYVQFRESGVKALALLGAERNSDLPELPTAAEQGYEVISQNMQFWWAPLGTPPERITVLADAIEAAMQTPEVQQRLAEMRLDPRTVRGQQLDAEIERIEMIASHQLPPGHLQHFPTSQPGSSAQSYVLGAMSLTRRTICRTTDNSDCVRS